MTSFVNYSDQVYFYLPQTLSARRPLERDKWLTGKRSAIGDASVFPPEALPTLTANEHTLAQRCSARINNPIIASPTFEEKRKKKSTHRLPVKNNAADKFRVAAKPFEDTS